MKKHLVKFISEFLPIISFFLVYKFYGIMTATTVLIITSIFGLIIQRIYIKKIAPMHLFTVVIVTIFGSITVLSQNPMFIKLKPTIIYLCFAGIIMFGLLNKKFYLKTILGEKLTLSDQGWAALSKRFVVFFISIAILNEFIWRRFSEETWIYFKTFGILPLSILFILSQIPFMLKHKA